MKCLIVFAHPEPRSFSGAMRDTAVGALRAAGHDVQISDLYAMPFNPVPGRHDFTHPPDEEYFSYESEQKRAHEGGSFAVDVRAEQEKLLRCDFLMLQFPLWWYSMPAIMKGWVDRVFAAGFAYGGGRWYDRGVFRGKRSMVVTSTGGPASSYAPNGLQGDMNAILFPIQHGILQFTGFDVLPPFVAYGAGLAEEREAALVALKARLRTLEMEEPLPFPSLESYDERLQLKEV